MNKNSRQRPQVLADLGVQIGRMPSGAFNALTDVPGVRVGHVTLIRGGPGDPPILRTGVTAVLPHAGNLFREKVEAAVHVINGFGKSVGLPQAMELGNIESPILLTGTLNVWRVADALVDVLSEQNPGVYFFNPLVCECNDSFLSDELARPVGREHVAQAVQEARSGPVVEGCVGAGTGMSGFGFKAGIGTASRHLPEGVGAFTLGVLVLTNTGGPGELRIDGIPVGQELIAAIAGREKDTGHGSIIIVDVAVDQGGCVETIHTTTHAEPTYVQHGVVHYGVPNMPAAVPRTSTWALTDVTLSYILKLAGLGLRRALAEDPVLRPDEPLITKVM